MTVKTGQGDEVIITTKHQAALASLEPGNIFAGLITVIVQHDFLALVASDQPNFLAELLASQEAGALVVHITTLCQEILFPGKNQRVQAVGLNQATVDAQGQGRHRREIAINGRCRTEMNCQAELRQLRQLETCRRVVARRRLLDDPLDHSRLLIRQQRRRVDLDEALLTVPHGTVVNDRILRHADPAQELVGSLPARHIESPIEDQVHGLEVDALVARILRHQTQELPLGRVITDLDHEATLVGIGRIDHRHETRVQIAELVLGQGLTHLAGHQVDAQRVLVALHGLGQSLASQQEQQENQHSLHLALLRFDPSENKAPHHVRLWQKSSLLSRNRVMKLHCQRSGTKQNILAQKLFFVNNINKKTTPK